MIISEPDYNIIIQDSVRQTQDTSLQINILPADTSGLTGSVQSIKIRPPVSLKITGPADTISVCRKNPLNEIIYTDTQDQIWNFYQDQTFLFPFNFIEKNKEIKPPSEWTLEANLKDGREIPPLPYNDDWIIIIVILSAFTHTAFSTFTGKLLQDAKIFLFYKGIGDITSRDRGATISWQSGIINFVSFSNTGLFIYCAADYYNFVPFGISGILLWLLFVAILISLAFTRYAVCYLTGNISGEIAVFGEYSAIVFQSFRISGLIYLFLTILLAYTNLLPPATILYTGLVITSAVYLMRVIRLFLIFLKRNVSILYLILYLCALEFLPVLIVLKYLTDLF